MAAWFQISLIGVVLLNLHSLKHIISLHAQFLKSAYCLEENKPVKNKCTA